MIELIRSEGIERNEGRKREKMSKQITSIKEGEETDRWLHYQFSDRQWLKQQS